MSVLPPKSTSEFVSHRGQRCSCIMIRLKAARLDFGGYTCVANQRRLAREVTIKPTNSSFLLNQFNGCPVTVRARQF
jgi:hypothetical protein